MEGPTWWQIVGAISTGVGGPLGIAVTLGIYYVRSTVKMSIDDSNRDQLEKLSKMYIPAQSSDITGREIEQLLSSNKEDLEKLREKFETLERYAHTRVHDISNLIQFKVLQKDT